MRSKSGATAARPAASMYIDDCVKGIADDHQQRRHDADQPRQQRNGDDQPTGRHRRGDRRASSSSDRYNLKAPKGVNGRNSDNTLIKNSWAGNPRFPAERPGWRKPTAGFTTKPNPFAHAPTALLTFPVARKNKSILPKSRSILPAHSLPRRPPSLARTDSRRESRHAFRAATRRSAHPVLPARFAAPRRARLPAPPHRGTRSPQRAGASGGRETRRRGHQADLAGQPRRHPAQPAQGRHRAHRQRRHRILLLDRSAPGAVEAAHRHARPAQRSLRRHRRSRL
jgi:hypothetical protein